MKKDGVILKKGERSKLLKKVPLWSLTPKETALVRTFIFTSHIDALVLIARITVHAQVQNHHPEIHFTYCKVKVTLTTHDVKGLTIKDFELAEKIDSLKIGG
jgi:4a-hydroxytetrahydrobiopterin dehydratase